VIPRWIHHIYAALLGYFWAPCPDCGKYFGGHEIYEPRLTILRATDTRRHLVVCPACEREKEDRALRSLSGGAA